MLTKRAALSKFSAFFARFPALCRPAAHVVAPGNFHASAADVARHAACTADIRCVTGVHAPRFGQYRVNRLLDLRAVGEGSTDVVEDVAQSVTLRVTV